jgi:hypothetical protein
VSALDQMVHAPGGAKPFGDFTVEDVQLRAAELRSVAGHGPTARVGPVARAWAELAREMGECGAVIVADLGPEIAERRAQQLWVVPPGGSLLG